MSMPPSSRPSGWLDEGRPKTGPDLLVEPVRRDPRGKQRRRCDQPEHDEPERRRGPAPDRPPDDSPPRRRRRLQNQAGLVDHDAHSVILGSSLK